MAVYKLFPYKDTSLYSMFPTMNTGIDPINQISNLNFAINTLPTVARSLIAFDTSEIRSVLDDKVTGNWQADIRSFIATAQGVYKDTSVEVFPTYDEWFNGTGTYLDQPLTTDGAAWDSPVLGGGTSWNSGGPGYTSSFNPSYSPQGGGNWFLSSSDGSIDYPVTQSFGPRTQFDMNINITSMVEDWYSGSLPNNGVIVKWEDDVEFNTSKQVQPVIQYYSVDTNTIYPPELEIKWDDQIFETGSLPSLDTSDIFVALDNNPGVFYSESVNRFRLNCRPDYPVRKFMTSSIDTVNHYLPSGSLWAIKDLDTNEFIVNFDDNYTKISCDSTSNYFDVYMAGLQPERYYKILIQTTISGSTLVKDDNYYFKVVNG